MTESEGLINSEVTGICGTSAVHCAIWYYLYNLKNDKNNHGESSIPSCVFFTFFNCKNGTKSRSASHLFAYFRGAWTNRYWIMACWEKRCLRTVAFLYATGNYMPKVNNRNTRTRCDNNMAWRRSGVFIVKLKHISHLVLVFLLLTLRG